MTIATTPTIRTGVAFSGTPRPLTCFPLLFILIRPADDTAPHRRTAKGLRFEGTQNYLCHFYLATEIMSPVPQGMIGGWTLQMKESSVTTGGKKRRANTTRRGVFFFFVVAAKQKAHSNVDPSLLWYGGQACWSSVCFCAPAQTSCNLAPG